MCENVKYSLIISLIVYCALPFCTMQLYISKEKVVKIAYLGREGGSGIIFACLAHMKVPFIADQLFFTEQRYRAVSKNY